MNASDDKHKKALTVLPDAASYEFWYPFNDARRLSLRHHGDPSILRSSLCASC